MTLEQRMRDVFDALAADDMDELVSNWDEDGIYFNPAVGPAAVGKPNVKSTIATMSTALQGRKEKLVIDRVTEVLDVAPQRAYVEWHRETEDPEATNSGKLGLHVVLFNEQGLLKNVVVFMHS